MTWKCGEIRTVRRTGVWASISSDWLLHCSTDLGKQGVCCGDCFPPCLFLSESGEPPTPTVWTMQLSHINSCRYFPLFVMRFLPFLNVCYSNCHSQLSNLQAWL
ncbi:hypothetical protein, unlikely [Trypanosoma brucei gambiense DAL972]|uniref:Uncharacterized protein n=1 Tax=Trypanosoma brucei gambiense (strain MHOM/CI/86/DAL972) TaxID=679716 RepID=C9ZW09_TRYB9|nr:hypothetical protein, unlikely [Trypanosoma brucei gambiense DAL972]CBH13597.1 hypothetical protein, unlikely [Trypanosoma brucei gambiense DAL972]|eukprot:XP_011775874.1 hypothetical protein, unlikely [Trypanosoma brucei gambiense DAL972]